MKIILGYKEPGTQITAYMFTEVFDAETQSAEALEAYYAVEVHGYEITRWQLVHDEDA